MLRNIKLLPLTTARCRKLSFVRTMDSLVNLSVHAFVNSSNFYVDLDLLKYVPAHLKKKILTVMCKRKCLTLEFLDALLTDDVEEIDFCELDVTDDHLKIIKNKCSKLKLLIISISKDPFYSFTYSGIMEVFPHTPLLTTFYARGSCMVNDDVIEALVENCPGLMTLDVGLTWVTNRALIEISTLANIRVLDVSTTEVDDEGVISLANGKSKESLRELSLNDCIYITDKSVSTVLENCKNLKIIVFRGCPRVTGNDLRERGVLEMTHLTEINGEKEVRVGPHLAWENVEIIVKNCLETCQIEMV